MPTSPLSPRRYGRGRGVSAAAGAALMPPGGSPKQSPTGRRTPGSGGKAKATAPSPGTTPPKKQVRDCACGKGLSCVGMTQAFRLLGDPRCHYVELPRFRKNPPAYKYVFRNNLRTAYVRHLAKDNPKIDVKDFERNPKRRYVALHHFHPAVVRAFYENPLASAQRHKVPISITEHEANELGVDFDEEDKILSMTGKPTGGYYFVPSYPQEKAHNDLKQLIQAERKLKEKMAGGGAQKVSPDAKRSSGPRDNQVPKNISISPDQEDAPTSPLPLYSSKPIATVDQTKQGDTRLTGVSEKQELLKMAGSKDTEQASVDTFGDDDSKSVSVSLVSDQGSASVSLVSDPKDASMSLGSKSASVSLASDPRSASVSLGSDPKSASFSLASDPKSASVSLASNSRDDGGSVGSDPKSASVSLASDPKSASVSLASDPKSASVSLASDPLIDSGSVASSDLKSSSGSAASGVGSASVSLDTQSDSVSLASDPSPAGEPSENASKAVKSETVVDNLPESTEDESGFDNIWNDERDGVSDEKKDVGIVASSALMDSSEFDDILISDEQDTSPNVEKHEVTKDSENELDQLKELAAEEFGTEAAALASSTSAAITPKAKSPEKAKPWHRTTPSGMHIINESENADHADLEPKEEQRKSTYFGSSSRDEGEKDEPTTADVAQVSQRPSSPVLSNEGAMYICNHQPPGTDPTMRIQVHSDLIAWESKRRSNLSTRLEINKEEWKTALEIIEDGVEEVECAERLVAGFAKAGRIFAEALEAMYDDKFLDNQGNTVESAFAQSRLMSQRAHGFEGDLKATRESTLLNSIIESQLLLANQFTSNSQHIEDEIFSEALDLRKQTSEASAELEALGESILTEMKQSEMELKKIWGKQNSKQVLNSYPCLLESVLLVCISQFLPLMYLMLRADVFDAMVTGDLMEYSMHGSMHGSLHGGSQSGGSLHGFGSGGGSVHGFLTPSDGGAVPIVSSVHSPLVKSTFKQLGGVEDGWLIEMYYRAAASYQRSVFEAGEKQLKKLRSDIIDLEEKRNRRLLQIMLAFIPRQRRLFLGLPDQLKEMLDSLVGFRVDEEALNSLIDESIADRSKNRLKSSTQHRSSIMNRSKAQATNQSASSEVESIEESFGDPFNSPQVLHCTMLEIKPLGLGGVMNKTWKVALAVVTSHGSLLLFEIPEVESYKKLSPTDAFKKLHPSFDLSDHDGWVQGRKFDLLKDLLPYFSVDLLRSTASVMKMRKLQCEVIEESVAGSGNRFLGGGSQRRCTIRLETASETADFVNKVMALKKQVLEAKPKQSSGRKMGFLKA